MRSNSTFFESRVKQPQHAPTLTSILVQEKKILISFLMRSKAISDAHRMSYGFPVDYFRDEASITVNPDVTATVLDNINKIYAAGDAKIIVKRLYDDIDLLSQHINTEAEYSLFYDTVIIGPFKSSQPTFAAFAKKDVPNSQSAENKHSSQLISDFIFAMISTNAVESFALFLDRFHRFHHRMKFLDFVKKFSQF